MIVWLASYPKSGNTWLRTIIGQFFEKDFNEDKVFEEYSLDYNKDWVLDERKIF